MATAKGTEQTLNGVPCGDRGLGLLVWVPELFSSVMRLCGCNQKYLSEHWGRWHIPRENMFFFHPDKNVFQLTLKKPSVCLYKSRI